MLGARERFDAAPFFWTQQHNLQLNYVGHAAKWDRVEIDVASASLPSYPVMLTKPAGGIERLWARQALRRSSHSCNS